jgi:DNA-binding MarR family transcriptional regulator
VGDVARYILIRPHTAAELVNRASGAGLVKRVEDPLDGRVVRLRLTARGAEKLENITEATFEELERLRPRLRGVWEGLHPATTAIEAPPA